MTKHGTIVNFVCVIFLCVIVNYTHALPFFQAGQIEKIMRVCLFVKHCFVDSTLEMKKTHDFKEF